MSDSGDGDGCVSSDGGGFGNGSDNYFIGFLGYHENGLSFSSIVLKQRSFFLNGLTYHTLKVSQQNTMTILIYETRTKLLADCCSCMLT